MLSKFLMIEQQIFEFGFPALPWKARHRQSHMNAMLGRGRQASSCLVLRLSNHLTSFKFSETVCLKNMNNHKQTNKTNRNKTQRDTKVDTECQPLVSKHKHTQLHAHHMQAHIFMCTYICHTETPLLAKKDYK